MKLAAVLVALLLPLAYWWVRTDHGDEQPAEPHPTTSSVSKDLSLLPVFLAPSGDTAPSTSGDTGAKDGRAHGKTRRRPVKEAQPPVASEWSDTSPFAASGGDEPAEAVEWKVRGGLTNVQIALIWEERGFGTAFEFLEALNDPRIAGEFNIPTPLQEGCILSRTYRFAKRAPARSVVRMMFSEFRVRTADLFHEAAVRYPTLSEAQVLTLASIIELESGDKVDRRRVSSVFHNRLRQGMRLEADPTLAFALGHPDRNLRSRDRWVQSPYNTYKIDGLPPVPICNVSVDSLDAAVYPVETEYLFFVSMGNGQHYFSRTYEEHQAAVERYRSMRMADAE